MVRINKYIANCGICSRRNADELVKKGKVTLNGVKVEELSTMVDEKKDIVCVNGKRIVLEERKLYIMLNKPVGYITTNNEQFGRKSTVDLIKEKERVFPIGRLDMDSEGLLLFTNDGDFSNKLMHPSKKVKKTYIVKLNKNISDKDIELLKNGIDIGDYVTKEAEVERITNNTIQMTISEGKNRQIRKMCEKIGLKVINLKRVKIGSIELGSLPVGKYRFLTKSEISSILNV